MKPWQSLIAYCAALAAATFLTAKGMLPGEVLAALLGAGLPPPWGRNRE